MNKAFRVVKSVPNNEGRIEASEYATFSLSQTHARLDSPRLALRHLESVTNLKIDNVFIGPEQVYFTCEGFNYFIEEWDGPHVPNEPQVIAMLRGN
jgi:hypothetical protein